MLAFSGWLFNWLLDRRWVWILELRALIEHLDVEGNLRLLWNVRPVLNEDLSVTISLLLLLSPVLLFLLSLLWRSFPLRRHFLFLFLRLKR